MVKHNQESVLVLRELVILVPSTSPDNNLGTMVNNKTRQKRQVMYRL